MKEIPFDIRRRNNTHKCIFFLNRENVIQIVFFRQKSKCKKKKFLQWKKKKFKVKTVQVKYAAKVLTYILYGIKVLLKTLIELVLKMLSISDGRTGKSTDTVDYGNSPAVWKDEKY